MVGAGICWPAVTHIGGLVLGQLNVDLKTNEIPLVSTILGHHQAAGNVLGTLITADAMHCEKDHAEYIVEKRGAHYLLTVKNNQPKLRRQLARLPRVDAPMTEPSTTGPRRSEKRTLNVVTISAGILFPHAAKAIQVARKVRQRNSRKWRTATVYAVTDVTARTIWRPGYADTGASKNRLQRVRDFTFRGRPVSGPNRQPPVMATLRNWRSAFYA